MIHRFVFVSFRIFDFQKICFGILLMIRFKFFNRMDSIRKSIENIYFQEKNFPLAFTVLLLLIKTCFLLESL